MFARASVRLCLSVRDCGRDGMGACVSLSMCYWVDRRIGVCLCVLVFVSVCVFGCRFCVCVGVFCCIF